MLVAPLSDTLTVTVHATRQKAPLVASFVSRTHDWHCPCTLDSVALSGQQNPPCATAMRTLSYDTQLHCFRASVRAMEPAPANLNSHSGSQRVLLLSSSVSSCASRGGHGASLGLHLAVASYVPIK